MAPQQNHQNVLMSDQHRLSEQLQLLYHFGYSDIDMRYQDVGHLSNGRRRKWYDTESTICILDTIAVALTTGRPGDVYAAAFDTSRGITLVLAKNDSPTAEDDQAVRDLFRWITAPETTGAYDVLPFLFTRCGANIAKRIVKMDDAVRDFSHALEEVLRHYTPVSSIDEECPYSTGYRSAQYDGQQVPFGQMMRELLDVIRAMVGDFDLQNLLATPDVYLRYTQLVLAAFVLKRSRLLRSLCESTGPMEHNRKLQAERLKHHLAKVCLYYHGIADLVTHTRCHFPQGIGNRWVDPVRDTGETTVSLEGDYLAAIERALGGVPPSADTLTTLHGKFPNMGGTWGASRSITTRLHAEIHILLHLSKSFDALDRSQQQPIGCSKRSCLCCTLWIRAYNNKYRTKWLTSGSHGKPYSSWALPGCSYTHALVADGRSEVDIAVMRGVRECLNQTIVQVFPNQRRFSDEYWSSGSEPGESDSEEERMATDRRLAYLALRQFQTIAQLFPNQTRLSDEHRSSGSESGGSDSEEERMATDQRLSGPSPLVIN